MTLQRQLHVLQPQTHVPQVRCGAHPILATSIANTEAPGYGMRRKDLREMRRRLEEEYDLLTCGYEPAYSDQREPWIKCHAGDVLTREEALRQIKDGRARRRPAR